MIEIKNVTKIYHINSGNLCALNNISFKIKKGTIFGLLGPNGAGKTTIIRILSTLLEPTKGTVKICSIDASKDPGLVRKKIGVVLGQRMIYHRLSGRANLEYYGALYGVYDIKKRIKELTDFFEIKERIDDLVETYSTGMRAKLALMRGMIHDPQVLLLDEPTLGLDPGIAVKLRKKIVELKNNNRTILLCTHYLHEAEEICDEIAILNKGEIVAYDTPKNLRNKEQANKNLVIYLNKNSSIKQFLNEFNLKSYHDTTGQYIKIPIKDLKDVALWSQRLSKYKLQDQYIHIVEPSLESIYLSTIAKKNE